jgi:hypothetical protein
VLQDVIRKQESVKNDAVMDFVSIQVWEVLHKEYSLNYLETFCVVPKKPVPLELSFCNGWINYYIDSHINVTEQDMLAQDVYNHLLERLELQNVSLSNKCKRNIIMLSCFMTFVNCNQDVHESSKNLNSLLN